MQETASRNIAIQFMFECDQTIRMFSTFRYESICMYFLVQTFARIYDTSIFLYVLPEILICIFRAKLHHTSDCSTRCEYSVSTGIVLYCFVQTFARTMPTSNIRASAGAARRTLTTTTMDTTIAMVRANRIVGAVLIEVDLVVLCRGTASPTYAVYPNAVGCGIWCEAGHPQIAPKNYQRVATEIFDVVLFINFVARKCGGNTRAEERAREFRP